MRTKGKPGMEPESKEGAQDQGRSGEPILKTKRRSEAQVRAKAQVRAEAQVQSQTQTEA
jgi:hypothetical protein